MLEQNFQFDLVSTDKLLLKYRRQAADRRAQPPAVAATTTTGTLLSSVDGLVLRGSDGNITALRDYSAVRFPDLPGGLITRPTLLWDIEFAARRHAAGARDLPDRRHHLVGRLQPDLQRRAGMRTMASWIFRAWVSIINQSGASYPRSAPEADRG